MYRPFIILYIYYNTLFPTCKEFFQNLVSLFLIFHTLNIEKRKGSVLMGNAFFRRASNKIGYQMDNKNTGSKLILIIFIVILILVAYTYNFIFVPILSQLGNARASQVGQYVVNQAINEVISNNDKAKTNLITTEKDNDGKITAVSPDVSLMNSLKSEIAITVSRKINETTNSKIKVPIGNISGISLLSNVGPKITFNLVPYGRTDVDFVTTFSEAGINQTRHRVDVKVVLNVALLLANKAISSTKIETTVPISETIIVGDVPSSYTNLETKEGEVREDALNIVD